MSANLTALQAYCESLEALQDKFLEVMLKLVKQEGLYAVRQAKTITQQEHIFNTGDYMRNWEIGEPIVSGNQYSVEVHNNLHYAIHLEYPTRGHYVPGYWQGNLFIYQPGFPGGVYMRAQPGHFVMRRAIEQTKTTQDARLRRKIDKYFREAIPK